MSRRDDDDDDDDDEIKNNDKPHSMTKKIFYVVCDTNGLPYTRDGPLSSGMLQAGDSPSVTQC